MKKKMVIAGGSGFLGTNLARAAAADYDVVILSRSAPRQEGPGSHVPWDAATTAGSWPQALEGADVLVNLAGRTVDCVKTEKNKREIMDSRVDTTRVLGEALRMIERPPPVWVQMSTAHIYGDPTGSIRCDEDSELGEGLAPDVGRAWEAAYRAAVLPSMRQVILRTSFVMGKDGGALERLAFLARIGLGGAAGSGEQGISWIHVGDMNRLFLAAAEDPRLQGVYIATAPNPVSNREFMAALRGALGVRIGLPAFAWMIRLGAPLVMRTDPELALLGRYCVSKRLREEGFRFDFPELPGALADIYRSSPS
jgi:hypothetical protein